MEKAIIIARCSTSEKRQNVGRQTTELYMKYNEIYEIVKNFSYYTSGKNKKEINNINSEILTFIILNNIKNIIITEISRIGRDYKNINKFITICNNNKINIIISDYNINSLNDDKSINEYSKKEIDKFIDYSIIELTQVKKRLESGRNNFIMNGGVLGRKKGSIENKDKFLRKYYDIIQLLKKNKSIRNISKITGNSTGTIQKVKRLTS